MSDDMNTILRRGFKRGPAEEPEKRKSGTRDVFEMDVAELLEEMKVALARFEEVQSEIGVRLEEAGSASEGEEERRG